MYVIIDGRSVDFDDILNATSVNHRDYHIDDMEPFLTITLKSGEKITTTSKVEFSDDMKNYIWG